MGKQWKSPEIQTKIAQIAAIKPIGNPNISPAHFRLVYLAQYQSEFFKNPRSNMRQAILRNGEQYFGENTNMEDVINDNRNSSNRTSQVLRKLGV